MDAFYLLLVLGFFALTWGFAHLCASLEPAPPAARGDRP
jgi:hypothetical protein